MKATQMVLEFHNAMEVPAYTVPSIPALNRCELRKSLLVEEVKEFCEAVDKQDIVGVADAITDIMYVAIGAAWEFGIGQQLGQCFAEVHRSNMSKLINGKPIKREDGKVMKPHTYSPPNLFPILFPDAKL